MQKSLKLYAKENPQRAQDLGVTDQRGQIRSGNRPSRIQNKFASDGDSSDSDSGNYFLISRFFLKIIIYYFWYYDFTIFSDEEGASNEPKKLKSKFFRATEKERDEKKRVAKEERRKRKYEDGFEGAGNC